MIDLVIVEDNGRMAAALAADLNLCPDFRLLATFPDGRAAVDGILAMERPPEVVLMDVEMPRMNGIESTAALKARFPQLRIIMTTIFEEADVLFSAIRSGADGYLLKGSDPAELERSIREVMDGGAPLSPIMARKSLQLLRNRAAGPEKTAPASGEVLTPREREVLEQLAAGLKYREVAANLFLSEATVRKHVENIYRKLRVNNKVGAVSEGRRAGYIP